ncbi:hypothetical protein WKI65_31865 [Streptomyces sp. MS1.AVA.3]|uniref:hypothetical protein n=1 Tax=Streptomyces decoyicus TaxID=249567 RepID=UPI0030BD1B4A
MRGNEGEPHDGPQGEQVGDGDAAELAARGLLGIRWAAPRGAWPMMTLGFAIQFVAIAVLGLIGEPSGTAVVTAGILMLGAFMFAQGFGPGAHIMSYASLGFPTSMRGVSIGFNQAVLRLGSTLTLFFFPVLSSGLGTVCTGSSSLRPSSV